MASTFHGESVMAFSKQNVICNVIINGVLINAPVSQNVFTPLESECCLTFRKKAAERFA